MARRDKQLGFEFRTHGGKRKGAGRKPAGRVAGISHTLRERISGREPVHVTLKLGSGLPNLRGRTVLGLLRAIFGAACMRFGFRLNEFSVQRNHLHLIAEAIDWRALSRGVKGLEVRVARALNKLWKRCGRVFADRYHVRILRAPLQVRNALVYVLNNAKKHRATTQRFDEYSSAPWFTGWRGAAPACPSSDPPVASARTWLLRVGWLQHGRISPDEVPAS